MSSLLLTRHVIISYSESFSQLLMKYAASKYCGTVLMESYLADRSERITTRVHLCSWHLNKMLCSFETGSTETFCLLYSVTNLTEIVFNTKISMLKALRPNVFL